MLAESSPDPLGVRGVRHVCPRGLLHGLLVELVFGERSGAQWTHPERGGDADLRYGRLRGGGRAWRRRRSREDIYRGTKKWLKGEEALVRVVMDGTDYPLLLTSVC